MTTVPSRRRAAVWWAATAIVAVVLFAIANNDTVYTATSPDWLNVHVLLRKAYSIVAFGTLGFCAARAAAEGGLRTPVVAVGFWLAAFSASIEIVQFMHPPLEGIILNAIDVVCGWLGGVLGALVARRFGPRRP